ncbi:MAG: hypothetical protein HKK67_06850 [Chlorobiaceae bacterium]|nr:hypothetical protein [Chlorobiaceae bacterium]
MEQEVPVIIHEHESMDPAQERQRETFIPEQVKEIGNNLSEAFMSFKESESYELLVKSAEKVKEYITKNPGQALLYSLAAGALFGLVLKRKR